MGFGRSGTSLMAGILQRSGYFLGNELYPPRESNPCGFFENSYINGINEAILKKFDYGNFNEDFLVYEKEFSPFKPGNWQRWLTYLPIDTLVSCSDDTVEVSILEATNIDGFAYKDPRFNYTVGVWNKYIRQDTVFICMIRQPEITVYSVLKECGNANYLKNFYIDIDLAFQLWFNSYSHLLYNLSSISDERVIYIHYEQLLQKEFMNYLNKKLDCCIDTSLISELLNRSKPAGIIPRKVSLLYKELCALAGFKR